MAPSWTVSQTQSACQAIAARCGQIAPSWAARAIIVSGEEKGKIAAPMPSGLSIAPAANWAKRKMSNCAIVTGIDRVCTSRSELAWEPMPRKSAPSRR